MVSDLIEFKVNEKADEDEYLQAMEELYSRKIQYEVTGEEWLSVWMLLGRRRGGFLDTRAQECDRAW